MTKRWTARRKAVVETYIDEVKSLMALSDWTIHYDWTGNEHTHPRAGQHPTAIATMTPFPMSKHTTLAISPIFLDLSSKDQTQVLTHELAHCHLFAIQEYASESFTRAVQNNTLAVSMNDLALNQHIETTTDALADAFASMVHPIELD